MSQLESIKNENVYFYDVLINYFYKIITELIDQSFVIIKNELLNYYDFNAIPAINGAQHTLQEGQRPPYRVWWMG